MAFRTHAGTATSLLVLASLLVPAIADARSYQRRNYAAEWEQEEREEEWREDQEKAREDWQEYQEEQTEKYYEHSDKQLDKVIDHYDRTWGNPPPAAPAPKKSGTCIYGADNQVLHQPDGVVCDKK
jgi:hypothetical protein